MPKKHSTAKDVIGKPASAPAALRAPVDATEPTTRKDLGSGRRTARSIGKSAGRRIATATKLAGKKVGETALRVSDLNKDGKVDQEDAKIATAKTKRITSKVADEAGTLAKKLGKHDMVKDAAAGAAIGAAVALPVPVVGPAAGAAIGAIVGVAKNLRSSSKPLSEAPENQPKTSTVKSAMRRLRKPRQSPQS
jgi:hypothetical protein